MKIVIIKKGWLRQKYHFCIVSSNGRILCTSENYYNLADVRSAIESIRFEVPNAQIVIDFKQ